MLGLFYCLDFSLVVARGLPSGFGVQTSRCSGFSCCGVRALSTQAPVAAACGLSSCGSRALELRLSGRGTWALLLLGMCDLPGPGTEPVSPALAGGLFFTTKPPGKPHSSFQGKILVGCSDLLVTRLRIK